MKTGIVLEGGGLRGAYHVGALQAFKEKNIEIQGVTGVSIGAINGALLALGKLDLLEELYRSIEPTDVIRGEAGPLVSLDLSEFNYQTLKELFNAVVETIKNRGLDITPLRELLEKYIVEEELRASPMRYGIGAVDLQALKGVELLLEEIPEGELIEFILASAYLPLFKAEKRRYLDGGFYNSIPLDLLIRSGDYDQIFVIRTGTINPHQSLNRPHVRVINPSKKTGLTLEFNSETIDRNIKLGYYDTLKILEDRPSTPFYLTDVPEDYFQSVYQAIPKDALSYILEVFHQPGHFKRREFRQVVIPEIGRLLRLKDSDPEVIGLALCEHVADYLGMDPLRTLTFKDFMNELQTHLKSYEPDAPDGYIRDRKTIVAKAMMIQKKTKWMVLTETLRVILGGQV